MPINNNGIQLNNFQRGIALSAYFGFAAMRGLNITDKQGIIYPNLALVKESGSVVVDLPEKFVKTSEGEVWGFTSETLNDIYKRTTLGVWSELSLHTDTAIGGIDFWKGHVAVILGATIDWYDITDDSIDTSWGASDITSANPHPSLASEEDDDFYIGSGNVIDKVVENDGQNFDPGTSASYTITKATMSIPEDYTITALEDYGNVMLIGTTKAGNSLAANVFVWDKTSALASRMIKIHDEGVQEIVVVNNEIFIRAGRKGRWYRSTNAITAELFTQIPTTLLDLTTVNLSTRGQAFNIGNLIYFAVSSSSAIGGLGLYSFNVNTGAINFEHIISANVTGADDGVNLGGGIALGGDNTNFVVGWNDINGSAFGVDDVGSVRYTADRAYLISRFYRLGEKFDKKTFEDIDIILTKAIVSGDSVKMYYRTAINGSWLSVFNNAVEDAAGDTKSFSDTIQEFSRKFIQDKKNIQFKIVLNLDVELIEAKINFA